MTISDLDGFVTSTLQRQIAGVSDQTIKRNALLKLLNDKGRIFYNKGGNGFKARMRTSDSDIGGAVNINDAPPAKTTNPWTTLSHVYAAYMWLIQQNEFEEDLNSNAGPEAKMFDLVMERMNEVAQSAQTHIGKNIYGSSASPLSTDTGTPCDGLGDILSATNTYMGVDRSADANAWLRAQTGTCSAAAFIADGNSDGEKDGLTNLKHLWNSCCLGAENSDSVSKTLASTMAEPDITITDQTGFERYGSLLQSQQRFTNADADVKQVLAFQGKPITWDSFVTANTYNMLNVNSLYVDVVGSKLLKVEGPYELPSPAVKVWRTRGQFQFYTKCARNNGIYTVTA